MLLYSPRWGNLLLRRSLLPCVRSQLGWNLPDEVMLCLELSPPLCKSLLILLKLTVVDFEVVLIVFHLPKCWKPRIRLASTLSHFAVNLQALDT